ncbi:hypothetical protein DSO57_1014680 [Entomophthora muscae]|uniref:Uncharacterized protein n=1 Tax=Entomophthora muscae TaxID=34485 RepID=A0ACC2SIB0_9FUNG|nr:hypothetical protein DSO57_1014680 [Entomophthora muscae]
MTTPPSQSMAMTQDTLWGLVTRNPTGSHQSLVFAQFVGISLFLQVIDVKFLFQKIYLLFLGNQCILESENLFSTELVLALATAGQGGLLILKTINLVLDLAKLSVDECQINTSFL